MELTTPHRKKTALAWGSHGAGGVKYRIPIRLCLAPCAAD
jgi:hypothetical protein